MSKVTGIALGRVLCDVLGISQTKVCRIELVADCRDGAKVIVTRFVSSEQLSELKLAADRIAGEIVIVEQATEDDHVSGGIEDGELKYGSPEDDK